MDMSGLREVIARAAAEASIAYHKSCNPSFWLNDEHVKDEIEIAEGGEMLLVADAVLRVLAEHGDTQQVREEIKDELSYCFGEVTELPVDRVTAVVARIVAARDAADEQLERSLAAQELMATQFRTMQREKEHGWREAERAEADLAAARQQLDQVRALAKSKAIQAHALGHGDDERGWLDVLIVVDARPAGHDETGQ
jgi:hypothetical protein